MKFFKLLLIIPFIFSCSAKKHSSKNAFNDKISSSEKIIKTAETYLGTKYKYGGLSKKGIDCSGLVYNAYNQNGVKIGRTTSLMKNDGKKIALKDVKKGDLLYFKTLKNKSKVNHVGIAAKVNKNEITFIHTSTSKGVMKSSLNNSYWKKTFVEARRYFK